jgi:hypothetical protein
MSDEQENVDAGSETPGETTVDTTAPEQSDTAATVTAETTAPETAQAEEGASADAGGAADANESRTAFVTGARPGDECICPDGRKGTVHKFDEGYVCIPNHEQG